MKSTIELRFYIPESADAAMQSYSAANGIDKNAVARDLCIEFARKFHAAHRLYARRVAADGLQAELPGLDPEDEGSTRSARR